MPMATPTPTHARSTSRTRTPPPQPTTPLRPPSRSSLRSSTGAPHDQPTHAIAALEPAFAELSDSMADLEANFVHLQLLHESVSRFNECFAAFLYGLNVNAFCVETPEAPVPESFRRLRDQPALFAGAGAGYGAGASRSDAGFRGNAGNANEGDGDQTFMTSDTSFVENPPTTVSKGSTYKSASSATTTGASARGQAGTGRAARGTRGSGVSRGGAAAGTRGSAAAGRGRASGLARPRYGSRGGYR